MSGFLFSSEKCGFPAGCNPLEACPGCIEEAVLLTAIVHVTFIEL